VVVIDHRPVAGAVSERVGTGSAAAMRHPGHHEDSIEVVRIADRALDCSLVVEAIFGGDGCIRPSGILDHFAAVTLERLQVEVQTVTAISHIPLWLAYRSEYQRLHLSTE